MFGLWKKKREPRVTHVPAPGVISEVPDLDGARIHDPHEGGAK